ncbi:MAG: sulfite exporter TauE/SafE family protein [Desulfovibrionaceae bacterium]|nr:sulfite exporter TauE/SafE family protein [Desulfovibrionaceae bacterium]
MDISLAATFLAWLVGGFVVMVTGLGGAMMVMPVLVFFVDLQTVVLSTIVAGLAGCLFQVWHFRAAVDWRRSWWLLLFSLPGSLAGVLALKYVPLFWLESCLGLLLIFFVCWQLRANSMASRGMSRESLVELALAGAAAGFFNGSVAMGGPPMAVLSCRACWDKDMARGVFGVFYLLNLVATAGMFVWQGLFTSAIWPYALAAVPGMLLGMAAGIPASRRISQSLFRNVLLIFIFCGALSLLYKAFAR